MCENTRVDESVKLPRIYIEKSVEVNELTSSLTSGRWF